MKHLRIVAAVMLAGIAGNVAAVTCSDQGYTPLNGPATISALSGKSVKAVAPDGEQWNEDHCATSVNSAGALYKAAADPSLDPKGLDPRAFRGTWTPQGGNPATVTYSYTVGGSSTYSWTLWGRGDGSLCWEGGGAIIATAPQPGPAGSPCTIP